MGPQDPDDVKTGGGFFGFLGIGDKQRDAGPQAPTDDAGPQDPDDMQGSGKSSILRRGIVDPLVSATKGVIVGFPEVGFGLSNLVTGGGAGRATDFVSDKLSNVTQPLLGVDVPKVHEVLKTGNEFFEGKLSPETQLAKQKVAEAQGFFPTLEEYIENPSAIVSGLAENVPGLLGIKGLGKVVLKTAGKEVLTSKPLEEALAKVGGRITTGEKAGQAATLAGENLLKKNAALAATGAAVGEGLYSAGQNIAQSMENLNTDVMTPLQLAQIGVTGLTTGLISKMSGGLANRLGIPDPDVMLQGVTSGNLSGIKNILLGVLGAAITEGALEELPQSAIEKWGQNLAEGRPPFEGVAEAGASGLLIGAIMGMGGVAGAKLQQSYINSDKTHQEIDSQLKELDPGGALNVAKTDTVVGEKTAAPVAEQKVFEELTPEKADTMDWRALQTIIWHGSPAEQQIAQEALERKPKPADSSQLHTVQVPKDETMAERGERIAKFGRSSKPPMVEVQLNTEEFAKYKKDAEAKRIERTLKEKAQKEVDKKEYAKEQTKFYQRMQELDENSALRQVLELVHEKGIATIEKAVEGVRTSKGKNTLTKGSRQILPGYDETTTDAIRNVLTSFGFSKDRGINKNGKMALDELADELNNKGTEAPPHIPGEEYTGIWDAKSLVYLLTHATPTAASKTSAQAEASFLEKKIIDEEAARKAELDELLAIPEGEMSTQQMERLDELAPKEDLNFNPAEIDEFEPGDVPFKSSSLYGRINARLSQIYRALASVQKSMDENPSPELKAQLETRYKELNEEKDIILDKQKRLTRGEESKPAVGRNPAKKSGDDNAIDFLARMDETPDHLTADQVISIFEQYTGGKFVYKWLAPLLNKYKVSINFDWKGEKLADDDFGQYDKNLITFGSIESFKKSDKGAHRQFITTFAHEAIHAIIDNALRGNSQASYRLKSRLDVLRKELIEYHKEHGGSERISAILNLRIGELAAYGFTDEEFARWMNDIEGKAKGETGSLWDKFKKIILDFIGAEAKGEATKLDELARILDDAVGIGGVSQAIMGTQTSFAFKDAAIKATKGTPTGVVIYRSGDTFSTEVWEWGDDVTYFGGGRGVAEQYGEDVKEFSLPKGTKLVSVLYDEAYGQAKAQSEGVIVCDGVSVYLPDGKVYSVEGAFGEFLKAGNQGIVEFPSLKELKNGFYENANFVLKNSLVKEMNMPIPANPNQMELPFKHSAWHGGRDVRKSKEGKLSLKHAGTGTGGTAQGHGLYFADLKQVSEYYRDLVTRKSGQRQDVYDTVSELIESIVDSVRFEDMDTEAPNKSLDEYIAARSKNVLALMTRSEELPAELNTEKVLDEVKLIAKVSYYDSKAEAYRVTMSEIKEAQRSIEKLVSLAQSYITKRDKGVLYKVELAPKPDEYLLWDEPLSRQSEKIKKALEQSEYKDYILGKKTIPLASYLSELNDTGASLYRILATAIGYENFRKSNGAIRNEPDEKAASEHLHSLGIRGNKYLDANSRGINTAGPTIVAYYDSGNEKVKVGYGKTIEEARENTDPNWFKQKIVEIKFETQERPKPTYNYVIFSEEDVEITEIFSSLKGIDKRLLAQKLIEGSISPKDISIYEKQMATRLMSLGEKKDFISGKTAKLFQHIFKKLGVQYERTIGTDRERGFYNLPQTRERQGRAVDTQKSAIMAAGIDRFPIDFIEILQKERLTNEVILGLEQEKANILAASKKAGRFSILQNDVRGRVRLKQIDKTIAGLEKSQKPTFVHSPEGYKNKDFARANELARENGYELIPIKDSTGFLNAFINRATKQIFSETANEHTIFQLIGHELSHVGVKGVASNKDTQMLIDPASTSFVTYRGELERSFGRKMKIEKVLSEYAADLQGGIEVNYGVKLKEGLLPGARVEVISKTAEYEQISEALPSQNVEEFLNSKNISYHGSSFGGVGLKPNSSESGNALFFTDNAFSAEGYGRYIHEVSIDIKNPLIYDAHGEQWFKIPQTKIIEQAKSAGHDAVIFKNIRDNKFGGTPNTVNAVFDTKNVKVWDVIDTSDENWYRDESKAKKELTAIWEKNQKQEVSPQDLAALNEALIEDVDTKKNIALKNGLISMMQTMKPFLNTAPQEVKDIYNRIKDFREFAVQGLLNKNFAGWLNSVVDYSSRWKGEKAEFRMRSNAITGKEEPMRMETLWNSLERKRLEELGTATTTRTKLDALTDLLNKTLPNAWAQTIQEEEAIAEAKKYDNVDAFIKAVSYVPTNKTRTVKDVQVRVFVNKNGKEWNEPVAFGAANLNNVGNAVADDFKEVRKDLYKKGWRQPSMYLRNVQLRQIWKSAHGVVAQTRREEINRTYAEQQAKTAERRFAGPAPREGKQGGKERSISRAAEGISLSKRKVSVGSDTALQGKESEVAIEALDKSLRPYARALANAKLSSGKEADKVGLREKIHVGLMAAIDELYVGNDDALMLSAETYADVLRAVEQAVGMRNEEFVLTKKEEEDLEKAYVEIEAKRAAQKMAIKAGMPVREIVIPKETFDIPSEKSLDTNQNIIRRGNNEIGLITMEDLGNYIELQKLDINRKASIKDVLAAIFKSNENAGSIRYEMGTHWSPKQRAAAQDLGSILLSLGAEFNFTENGSEYILNRDAFGAVLEKGIMPKEEPAQAILKQKKQEQGNLFGIVEQTKKDALDIMKNEADYAAVKDWLEANAMELNDEGEILNKNGEVIGVDEMMEKGLSDDAVDALYDIDMSWKWHPVNLPGKVDSRLSKLFKGGWVSALSEMATDEAQKFSNQVDSYGGIKHRTARKIFSLPYQNTVKSNDWKRVYHILGELRVEHRERLTHKWIMKAQKYLNRRKYFKDAGYSNKERNDADYRIGRIVTIGDANLVNVLFDLEKQVADIDKQMEQAPLLRKLSSLDQKRSDLQARIDRYNNDRAYSFEETQDGIKDDDGTLVKLNGKNAKLEYEMYRAIRSAEDSIFETTLGHMKNMLMAQYRNQKWFKVFSAAIGQDLSDTEAHGLVDKLQGVSTIPGISRITAANRREKGKKVTDADISIKLGEIFRKINITYDTFTDTTDVVKKYERLQSQLTKEMKALRDYVAELYGVAPTEQNLLGEKKYAEIDQAVKEMFIAYQRTRPRLKQISALRNDWKRWPAFFPRKREQGLMKFQMFENQVDPTTGVITKKEIYSGQFSSKAEGALLYAKIVDKYGKNGELDNERYSFSYPAVVEMPEGSFDGIRDFNVQALIDAAFENMEMKGDFFDSKGKPVDLKGQVWDAAYEAIAGQYQARGASAHGIKRKQKPGEQAIKGYLEEGHDQILLGHITSMAGLLTKQEAALNVMDVMNKLEDKTRAPELREYIQGQLRNDNKWDRLSSKLRSLAFVWYLGAMVKSAAVNSTQPYIVGVPMLDNYIRDKKIKRSGTLEQMKASKDIALNGGLLFKDPSDWGELKGVSSIEQRFLEEGVESGSMAAQHARFIKGQTSDWGRVWNKTFDYLAMPFASVERYNRFSSGLAMFRVAYNYHLQHMGKGDVEGAFELAMNDATTFINNVHYPIGKHNLPILAQGGDLASVTMKTAYIFRPFTHNFLLNQFNLLRSAAKLAGPERSDLEIRQQATNDLKTFIHTMALVALFGGLMGLPFLKDIFDWYEKHFGYSPKQWVRETLRGIGGDTLETFGMSGLPAVLGGNISGSLSIGIPFVNTNPESIFGVYAGLVQKAGKAGEAAMRGDPYRMVTNLTPEFLRNPIVALTESDFGHQTLGTRGFATTPQGMPSYATTGKPLSLTGGEVAWKTLGFQPTRYAKEREIEQTVKSQVLWAKESKKRISETFRIDRLQKDPNALKTMMSSVRELNTKIKAWKIPETPARMSTIIKNSRETKNLQKRRELKRRSQLMES